jgi:hypothetical protein
MLSEPAQLHRLALRVSATTLDQATLLLLLLLLLLPLVLALLRRRLPVQRGGALTVANPTPLRAVANQTL